MARHFSFQHFDAVRQVIVLKMSGGGEEMNLGVVGLVEREALRVLQWVLQRLERGRGHAVEQVNLSEPEPGRQVVWHQLANA